jgi:hypothetical protein
MRSDTSSSPARRLRRLAERRSRRRPAIVAASLAVGLLATAGVTGALPVSGAQAVSVDHAAPFNDFALVSYSLPAEPALIAGSAEASAVVTEARAAISAADNSIAAVESVQADIVAAGVDLGTTETEITTDELAQAAERLERGTDAQHTVFLPGLTEDVVDLVDPVDAQVAQLRATLDAAIAEKARIEAESAEKARLEAEAAAAAEAEAAAAARTPAAPAAPNPVYATGGSAGDNSPGGAQASARAMLPEYGWGDDQFACLVSLWNKESGWNYQAYNASSGATGIPQALPGSKMASAGGDWQTNAATQVRWGLGYIAGRYGSPCGAWGHSQSVGWY